jgi:hypothetical protein
MMTWKVDAHAWAFQDECENRYVPVSSVAFATEPTEDMGLRRHPAEMVSGGMGASGNRQRAQAVLGEDAVSRCSSQRSTPRTVAVYSTASLNEAQRGRTHSEEALYEPAILEASRKNRGGSQFDNRRQ